MNHVTPSRKRLAWSVAAGLCAVLSSGSGRATSFVIEAESLEVQGDLLPTRDFGHGAREYLSSPSPSPSPAAGAVELPHAGRWRLWVRSKDYPKDRPGTRNFTVRVGAKPSEKVFGRHGQEGMEGWLWEDGGEFDLQAGPNLIVIGEKCTPFARCDALMLTDNMSFQPQDPPWKLKQPPAKMVPVEIRRPLASGSDPEPLQAIEPAPVASLRSETMRLDFHRAGPVIALQPAVRAGDKWVPLAADPSAESYRVLFRPRDKDPRINAGVHPSWDMSFAAPADVGAGGAWVRTTDATPTTPWAAGKCFALRPSAATAVDARTVELEFPPTPVGRLKATWRLAEQPAGAAVSLEFAPSVGGHFSLGYHGSVAAAPADLDFLLLPFMFHGKRFPSRPVTLLNALTPTPMALVNRAGASYALVAEPAELPFEWASATNSRYALGIRNQNAQAQPLLYTPVLGQPGSVCESGAPVRGRFRVWIQPGDWFAAYRGVAEQVFGLNDYRRPTTSSLSDAAINLFDLLRNERSGGWDARGKGSWNIESRNISSHASPLTFLSYYLLTGDEEFYNKFARPALEFLLSRPGAHFGAEPEIGDNYYQHQTMRGPVSVYGAATFAGALAMTHGRTPAFGECCLKPDGTPRVTHGYSHVQPFEDALALYRLTGETRWRDMAVTGADAYIAENLRKLPTKDLGTMPFINMSFVPDWEGLLHVHDATGERRFRDASVSAARWLLTTLWVQPPVPAGEVTIHPGGRHDHARHIWYLGDKRYRLGVVEGERMTSDPDAKFDLPPTPLPEKRLPAWQASNVGLGLEQPCTYTRRGNHANILMSTWAPNLLRLATLAQEPLFRTAARNATIGRFGNYPGYYLDGMTDQYQRPDYPIVGPDVTTIYHHHIPPFAAYVLDYLFTDAEVRSEGAIQFPAVRQCGYVWFDARLRGHAPGAVYGQPAWPWLHRTAATVDTPNVDRVLAHGDGKFHVVLLNQVREPQKVCVKLDARALGRDVGGAWVWVRQENRRSWPKKAKDGVVSLELAPLGIAALTLDGVKIDVSTHRAAPPAKLALPTEPALRRQPIDGTKLEAIGTEIVVPPFTWRDLFVYVAAKIGECQSATLRYRVGDGPERQATAERFPWEFSVRVDDMRGPVTWAVDVTLADGRVVRAP